MFTDLSLQLYEKDYTDWAGSQAVRFSVVSLSRDSVGGDKEAKVIAKGAELDLWQLLDMLRNPARIYQLGAPIWRGFVKAVTITAANGLRITASTENLYNKFKCVYTALDPGESGIGEQAETSWYSNTDSIALYGTRQKILSLSDVNSDQAAELAQRAVNEYCWPLPERDLGNLGQVSEPSAEITLAGWFETLDWMLYTQNAGIESYTDIVAASQDLGDAAGRAKLDQSFQLGTSIGWYASQVAVRLRKIGSPVDNLIIELCPDSSGAPGTALASATIAGANVPENTTWVTYDLSSRVSLSLSTTYHIQIRRSGSADASNYYQVDTNEALGYTRGAFKIYNGSAWVARSPDADMLFQVLGVTETTNQVSLIVTACGQFLTSTEISDASGVYASPYRDGTQSGLAIIQELLKSGTTNERRLRVQIDDDRRMIVSEEPALGTDHYSIDRRGMLFDPYGNELLAATMPAGVWLELKEVIPLQAQFAGLQNPTAQFVESVTYQAGGKLSWKFRGQGGFLAGVD